MRGQAGFFDVDERLKELSDKGDHLEQLNAIIDFERFRADLQQAVVRADRSRGGRPAFDHVFMLTHQLSLIEDRSNCHRAHRDVFSS
jgi:transposase, IS5 family